MTDQRLFVANITVDQRAAWPELEPYCGEKLFKRQSLPDGPIEEFCAVYAADEAEWTRLRDRIFELRGQR